MSRTLACAQITVPPTLALKVICRLTLLTRGDRAGDPVGTEQAAPDDAVEQRTWSQADSGVKGPAAAVQRRHA